MRGACVCARVWQGVSEGSDPSDLEQDQERKQREISPLWDLFWVGLVSQCLEMQGVGCGIIVCCVSTLFLIKYFVLAYDLDSKSVIHNLNLNLDGIL